MTFRQVVIKNFIGNVRQYLAFFLCSTFSIVVYFINITLVFNKQIAEGDSADLMSYLLPITVVGISVFSIFFIIYANNSFVKGRYKELGVYLTLGMDNKEIRHLVNGQNLIIGGGSIACGIFLGAMLSRIFQMAIIRILSLEQVSFHLDIRSFLVTITMFVVIFSITFIQNNIRMKRLDILGLLKEEKQMSQIHVTKITRILGVVGLALLALSVWYLLCILGQEKYYSDIKMVFLYLGILFTGIYLTISKGGEMIISYRKKKNAARFNLLSIAETEKKYSQNKRILFVLSILSSMTIVLVASPFSLLSLSESLAELNCNDIEYVETASINQIDDSIQEQIINQEKVTYNKESDFIFLYKDTEKETSVPIVSVDDYNKATGENIILQQGQCVNIVVTWLPGAAGFEAGSQTTLYGSNGEYQYQIVTVSHGPYYVNQSYASDVMLLVSDADFQKLASAEGGTNWGKYHMIGYENWKNTQKIVDDLSTYCTNEKYPVLSIINTYDDLKKGYSAFLFIATVLGILFFVSGGTVLYFRQFTELERSKQCFYKLYKIGITRQETKRIISKELAVIFFVPLIFGIFGGVSIINMLTHMFGGTDVLREFLLTTCKVVVVYFIFQAVFYYVTRKQYVESCSN